MNLKYLGDTLDHWKGCLFEYLQAQCVLRDFAVDPMATEFQDAPARSLTLSFASYNVSGTAPPKKPKGRSRHACPLDGQKFWQPVAADIDQQLDWVGGFQ
jgi:hypothetical protein